MQFRILAAAAALSLALSSAPAFAQIELLPQNSANSATMVNRSVMCPAPVSVVLTPTAPAAGWQTNNAPVHLALDAKNPPRVESNTLICYYAMPDGSNAFVYFQPLGNRTCTVRDDKTGFRCQ